MEKQMSENNQHSMLQSEMIVSNAYTNEIDSKYEKIAKYLKDYNYFPDVEDVDSLRKFLEREMNRE